MQGLFTMQEQSTLPVQPSIDDKKCSTPASMDWKCVSNGVELDKRVSSFVLRMDFHYSDGTFCLGLANVAITLQQVYESLLPGSEKRVRVAMDKVLFANSIPLKGKVKVFLFMFCPLDHRHNLFECDYKLINKDELLLLSNDDKSVQLEMKVKTIQHDEMSLDYFYCWIDFSKLLRDLNRTVFMGNYELERASYRPGILV